MTTSAIIEMKKKKPRKAQLQDSQNIIVKLNELQVGKIKAQQ